MSGLTGKKVGIIGKKLGMTSVFDGAGNQVVCTVLLAGPCAVTQIKTVESDGYEAVQLGFGERKEKNTPRAQRGHFKSAGVSPKRAVMEFRDFPTTTLSRGDEVRVESIFQEGQLVDVSGVSKGKGFQGVVRRHNFGGVGMSTHGQHNRQRKPGSLGQSSDPSRVFKGVRMAGRMGGKQVKVRDLTIVRILPDSNLMLVEGAVPGPDNSYVKIELS